jgi:phosphoribosylformylglycinamidine synthase subunit PurSL
LIQEGGPLTSGAALRFKPNRSPSAGLPQVLTYAIQNLSESELAELSKKQHWALSAEEMRVIQDHFRQLGRAPTDVEMEILAQTWSEHCKHKIFRAHIDYQDLQDPTQNQKIKGLFKTFIQTPTENLKKKKDWLVSVFSDNAGIVRFHDDVDVCIKVETHNSPSALDPYGGALTGILGVNRDILGTGLGAKPIANSNVLCFGNPHQLEAVPKGLFHPREVMKGVHHGIQDGGNKSGIPTVNGAMIFDESFSGKPLVYCGTVGVMPRLVTGRPSHIKGQKPKDRIVVVGGSVGLDGIHGATSSSLGLDASTPVGMVQIGDPLTQKRVLDFILKARDLGLYSSITDNGAGGISSSIGEMAAETGGAKIDLARVPLKYPNLQPWQIMVSESQERMTYQYLLR